MSSDQAYRVTANIPFHEANLLKLNCDKAQFHLKWAPTLDYAETIRLVGDWYSAFYQARGDMYALTLDQIAGYERTAGEHDLVWARSE